MSDLKVMAVTQTRLLKTFVLFIPALLLLGAIFLAPRLYNDSDAMESGAVIKAGPCHIKAGDCSARRGDLAIDFTVDGEVVRSYSPLEFTVTVTGMQPDTVVIEFEGVEMFMGINRLALDETAGGRFTGTLALPGHAYAMTWRARVSLNQGDEVIESWFEFELE